MGKPWERYAQPDAQPAGPWSKYRPAEPTPTPTPPPAPPRAPSRDGFNPMLPGMPGEISPETATGFLSHFNPMLPGLQGPATRGAAISTLNSYDSMLPGMPRNATPMRDAMEGWANEIGGALQRVQPAAVADHYPVGRVVREGEQVYYVPVDSAERVPIPREEFGNFVTMIRDGDEWLYVRDPEGSMDEGPLASLGRLAMGSLVGNVPGGLLRTLPGAASQTAARAGAMSRSGITPSLGMTGPVGARIASVGEGSILTANRAGRDAARALDETIARRGQIADRVGAASTEAKAGEALQGGAEAFLEHTIRGENSIAAKLEDAVGARLGDQPVDMTATQRLLGDIVGQFDRLPGVSGQLGLDKWRTWIDDIAANGGRLSWPEVRALRTFIGEQVGKVSGPMADRLGSQVKRLYGALSDDLGAAASAAGPAARAAWERSNSFYRRASERVDGALSFLFGDKSPENAYARFLRMTQRGSSADVGALSEVKDSVLGVAPEAWGDVLSTVIRRMGEARPGAQNAAGDQFSAATFMTEWARMSEEAKGVLFGGRGAPAGLRQELEDLASVMEAARDAGLQQNVSRSGTVGGNLAVLGAASMSPKAWIVAAGAILTHRGLTNPAYLRWVRNRQAGRVWKERGAEIARQHPQLESEIGLLIRLSESLQDGATPSEAGGQGTPPAPLPQTRALPAR